MYIFIFTKLACFDKNKSPKNKLILFCGPYLVLTILIQNGYLNDRSKDLRIATQEIIEKENLYNKKIEYIETGISDESSSSKLIKIAIFMPNLVKRMKNIESLESDQYAWTVIPKEELNSNNEYKLSLILKS